MSLHSKIETKLSEALKAQDKKTYSTLRLIIAAIKDLMIDKKSIPLSMKWTIGYPIPTKKS